MTTDWWMSGSAGILVVAALILPHAGTAQSIAEQVGAAEAGRVRMSFAAKSDVCGDGESIRRIRRTDDWEGWCEHGPVRVVLHVRDRRVVDVDTYVGGRWRSGSAATDLGLVSAPEAADYLLSLAATLDDRAGREAIVPAVLADSTTVWPRLLAIAKDGTRPRETRRSAVFWLGQAASAHATRGLEEIIDDDDTEGSVREQAVFALSQQSTDESVTVLIRIARSHPSAGIRKKALFWLGQSDDPRAVGLFEEILLQP